MCVKFHCPASALTLCCKDGQGETHSSSDIESQKTLANSSFFPIFDFFKNMLLSALDSIC